mmetsp:Transcript_98229/g.211861  ORF Transcript_98229/g.211861 Transcript_98229/m.211861 type:complete len:218 (+) Transcript_98229:2389-3042(+)
MKNRKEQHLNEQQKQSSSEFLNKNEVNTVNKKPDFCEGSRDQVVQSFLNPGNKRSFGFYLSRNIKIASNVVRSTGALKQLKQLGTTFHNTHKDKSGKSKNNKTQSSMHSSHSKTFYKSIVDQNRLRPFWSTIEGIEWYNLNQEQIPEWNQEKLAKINQTRNLKNTVNNNSLKANSTANNTVNLDNQVNQNQEQYNYQDNDNNLVEIIPENMDENNLS